jgi:hypothetical protein
MINGSVVRPTIFMSEKDSIDAFVDGAKRAISAAKELAKKRNEPEWITIAETLNAMAHGGKKLSEMKAISRFENLMACSLKANPKGFLN